MIEKGEMIMGGVELFDALEEAKRAADEAKRRDEARNRAACEAPHSDGGPSSLDARMIEAGRAEVYGSSTYSWERCDATRDEETGAIAVTPYEKWRKSKVNSVPEYMSRTDFYEYFADRLKADYEREKQDAIAKLAVEGSE